MFKNFSPYIIILIYLLLIMSIIFNFNSLFYRPSYLPKDGISVS
jgi:hypothetical protein